MSYPYAVHWFRRDLRVQGNPALQWVAKKYDGKVLGLFCFDPTFISRKDFSHARFQFFLKTLRELRKELQEAGGELLVLGESPIKMLPKLFKELEHKPAHFTWNRDYEPFARQRDAQVEKFLTENGIAVHTETDHLLVEPHELLNFSGKKTPYQIYTPFSKIWLAISKEAQIQNRMKKQGEKFVGLSLKWGKCLKNNHALGDKLEDFFERNGKKVTIPIPEAGHKLALSKLKEFKNALAGYSTARDFPSIAGTSQLSVYLKNGSLTTAQIIKGLDLFSARSGSAKKYLNELIWREFYYHILYFYPEVEKQSFKKHYSDLNWENDPKLFDAWKEGKTGYPIVDAGMRQLNETGWMHNRVRMIVASFLTKDLLIDWRWGEKYFMEKLLDGDLAPNNGGWQWAASTGCDAQPYFRVFNPTTQSEKFDPEGSYLKKWIPELRHLNAKTIHNPLPLERGDYPEQVVDHAERREKAIALFNRLSRSTS